MIEDMKAIIEEFEKETGIKVVGERGEFFYKKFAKWLKAKVESLTKEKTEIAKLLREDELCLANKDEEIESLQDEVERLKNTIEFKEAMQRSVEEELAELTQKINDSPKVIFEFGTKIDVNNSYTYFEESKTVALLEIDKEME